MSEKCATEKKNVVSSNKIDGTASVRNTSVPSNTATRKMHARSRSKRKLSPRICYTAHLFSPIDGRQATRRKKKRQICKEKYFVLNARAG